MKHWKRRLRWKRNRLALGMCFLAGAAGSILYATNYLPGSDNSPSQAVIAALTPEDDQRLKEAADVLKRITDSRESYLLKSYVCGEERIQLGLQSSEQLLDMQVKHPDWILSVGANGNVTFTEHIEDLSPACKEKAVFGIDGSSNLSLFNGTPDKDNVIRTFFQLNIKYLESSLPPDTVQQLKDGIRISDMEEYNSVLSTFSDYAVEETERAMTTP
ncbi:BofC C-terminal domain-containing protein [Bacillus sp. 3255]|uniref:BofC C-terminal domain-containing protein n=1 Tax=Bacillus sp. 3255 TaxID=2817904 RepID=UPI00286B48C8|nr:BofC C-terminal domain-containing protein [Bacillus sp. 3255]